MANTTNLEQAKTLYRNSYHSIAGVDIKAVFFGKSFGNLQAISYSITREKAPIYTIGSPEPRGFARGKRGIAGSLIMVMFDDHALLSAIEKAQEGKENITPSKEAYKFVSDKDELRPLTESTKEQMQNYTSVGVSNFDFLPNTQGANNVETVTGTKLEDNWAKETPWYSDQIPSFNIVLTGVNEEGYAATMSILGVEILNEGYGISIDDLISEQQMTYVARAVARWRKVTSSNLIIGGNA